MKESPKVCYWIFTDMISTISRNYSDLLTISHPNIGSDLVTSYYTSFNFVFKPVNILFRKNYVFYLLKIYTWNQFCKISYTIPWFLTRLIFSLAWMSHFVFFFIKYYYCTLWATVPRYLANFRELVDAIKCRLASGKIRLKIKENGNFLQEKEGSYT